MNHHEAAIQAENRAVEFFRQLIRENSDLIRPIAHWGEGRCGYLAEILQEELLPAGAGTTVERKASKQRISRNWAKRVFERDAYRCVECTSHIDLTCDHIVPESKGGETTFENLQTMCRPCNSKKGVRV